MAPLGNAVGTYGPVRSFELAYRRVLGVVYHRLLWVVGITRCPYGRVPDTPKMSARHCVARVISLCGWPWNHVPLWPEPVIWEGAVSAPGAHAALLGV